jgi:hypothetical protein
LAEVIMTADIDRYADKDEKTQQPEHIAILPIPVLKGVNLSGGVLLYNII